MESLIITLYDEIVAGDAQRVLAQLSQSPHASVDVRINSPGGSVADGLAIYNALLPRRPTVYIDGVAASIASMIAMAGAKVIAAANALLMVHDPWVGTEGNAEALRQTATVLDKHRDAMLSAYTAKTRMPRDDIAALMTAETWLSADEAVELGFVDEITQPLAFAAHARECFAAYRNTPARILEMNAQANAQNNNGAVSGAASGHASTVQPMDALRERNAQIRAMLRPYARDPEVQALELEALADPDVSVDEVRAEALALIGRRAEPSNGGGGRVGDRQGPGDFVAATSDMLALRAGINLAKVHPAARDVQGMSLLDVARACVSRAGQTHGLDTNTRGGVVKAAMTTTDFPAILQNTLGKALRNGYEVEPRTFDAWTRQALVSDFRPQSRPILGSAPDLLPVPEGSEYKSGSMDDDKSVPYSVGKFGRIVRLTWETIVNDDLGAFLRVTQAMGQAAARAEADQIYATFASGSGAGPNMQDNIALFHADHGNLASSAAALDADALGSARVLMRRQTAVGGGYLNLVPRYLLVAPEQEQAAETLLAAAARAMLQTPEVQLTPAWLAQLELVVEARLTDSAFYLLASPSNIDTVERGVLDSDGGAPVINEEDGFNVDSHNYKVRYVFASRWLDWRGVVKVPLS